MSVDLQSLATERRYFQHFQSLNVYDTEQSVFVLLKFTVIISRTFKIV